MHFNFFVPASFLLPSATKLRRLCFYRRASVHTGGCLPQCMLGYHTPRSRHPHSRHPPPRADPLPPRETVTAADGTHPTGIHSCNELNIQSTDHWRVQYGCQGCAPAVQVLSFSCSFRQKMCKITLGVGPSRLRKILDPSLLIESMKSN